MTRTNCHCCVVEIAGIGIMIRGSSGSGKTSLALGLVDSLSASGHEAILVTDDQALLEAHGTALIAHAPGSIAGKAELHGFGIIDVKHKDSTSIGLVVNLVDQTDIERMPEEKHVSLNGIRLKSVDVPIRHEQQSLRIVRALLFKNLQLT